VALRFTMKKRRMLLVFLLLISFAGAWSLYHRNALNVPPPYPSLAQAVPEGPLLYIEAKNFSNLLSDWNSSPEKANWLESENNDVFSNSRMLLRLQRFYENFAVAAGVPPDTRFVADAAGRESVFALYDIGKIEFLYITHLPSAGFLNSVLWRSRNKFQPRSAGGTQFFTRKDNDSGQVVAFAVAGDYLLLATREDLMAHALEMLNGRPGNNLQQESWFAKAVSEAPAASSDLRMVLNLSRIAVAPQFRTYWIQQNITEMKGYTASVCDLYREGQVYREERVLLRKTTETGNTEVGNKAAQASPESSSAVAALLPLAPSDFGFYQIRQTTPHEALEVVEQKILSPHVAGAGPQNHAPQVVLTSGEIGLESDLDTRIDVAPPVNETRFSRMRRQFEQSRAEALLVVQGTRDNGDGVLLTIPSAVVVAAARNWDEQAVQSALQSDLAAGMSVATLGLDWQKVDQAGRYFELNGVRPLQLAVRGKFLYISMERETLAAMLQGQNSEAQPQSKDLIYVASFNHARERQNFYDMMDDIDHSSQATSAYEGKQPHFFSENIASLSNTLERLESEKITVRQRGDKVFQTVTYQWSK